MGGATLDRPGTTQRSGGRVAMTVLRGQQQAAATALPQLGPSDQLPNAQHVDRRSPRSSLFGAKQASIAEHDAETAVVADTWLSSQCKSTSGSAADIKAIIAHGLRTCCVHLRETYLKMKTHHAFAKL